MPKKQRKEPQAYGKMQSENIPETTWKQNQIMIDFIEPLPGINRSDDRRKM